MLQNHYHGPDRYADGYYRSKHLPAIPLCQNGLPTFAYAFEELVNNVLPYLCSFRVMKIQTHFQMEGISKQAISLEDQKKLLLEGKKIQEINFEGSQLEKQVVNKGANALIDREMGNSGEKV